MGKHLERMDSCVGGNQPHPGCMWGILHILDNHHWHNVKKMLPYKRHGGRRRVKGNGSQNTILGNRDVGEVHNFMDAEAEPLLVKEHRTDSIPANKRHGRASVKSSNGKKRGASHKFWILSYPVQPWSQKTNSIHHLEPSEKHVDETSTEETNPIILPHSSGNTRAVDYLGNDRIARKQEINPEERDEVMVPSVNQKLKKTNQINGATSNNLLNEYDDILEIFKANKEFFLKILQDPDVYRNHIHGLKNSSIKVKLTKSRSFPVADSSQIRTIRTSTLKHKQNEGWFFQKRDKSLSGNQATKSVVAKSQKDQHSLPYTADDNGKISVIEEETSGTSASLSHGLNNHGWNQMVLNRFRDIKQKIKHVLKESNKKNNQTTTKETFHSVPFVDNEMSGRLEITIGLNGNGNDNFNEDLSKRRMRHVRRSSSLNESMDKYTQLFETSFGRDTKFFHSRSLKLTNEEKASSSGRARKSCSRNLSLPDLDNFCSFLNGAPHDAPLLGIPIKTIVDQSSDKGRHSSKLKSLSFSEPLDVVVETDYENSMVERSDSSMNIEHSTGLTVDDNDKGVPATDDLMDANESAMRESSTQQEKEIGFAEDLDSEFPQPSETCFTDGVMTTAEFPMEKGSQLNPTHPHMDESDSTLDLQNRHSTDSLPAILESTSNSETYENENKCMDNRFLHFAPDIMENVDFNYVRNVLELSGFTDNEQLRACHSLDQPLDFSLFEELEACFHDELECHEEEVTGDCDHQILFDLVNETLQEMNENCFTYFPRAFSFSCKTRPMRKGQHLLEEVWPKISSYLSLRPELDQSLDDVVARDLAKGDGWMNVQWETQFVALELEDLIFDQLLDEVICS